MDTAQYTFYMHSFELNFHRKKGEEFQNFFSNIMERCHPNGDFMPFRPWGKMGDRKNDGYLKSERTIFAVHAAEDSSPAHRAIKKIDDDFRGALPYWKQYFDKWVYVHNHFSGIPMPIGEKILSLGQQYPQFSITHWGFAQLQKKVQILSENDLFTLFGPAPTSSHMSAPNFAELEIVISTLAQTEPSGELDIRPTSPLKLSFNNLSNNIHPLLTLGMSGAANVERFFSKWSDPTLADRIADGFKRKYQELRGQGLPPSGIFFGLQEYTGGINRNSPEREAAVWAVLAYFFEKCDIFERPPESL
jgi:hypothetical protein